MYPSKPIRMIYPFTSGSTVDVMARVVQDQLSQRLGQNIVADSRPGANGIIGTEIVTRARPDGYTLLKGSAPALTEVIGRQVDMTFISTVSVMPFIKSGRVKPLALTGGERSPVVPQVPTFKEIGYPDFKMTGWYGLWFPAKAPAPVVARINGEVKKAVASPEMKAKLDELGLVGVASSPSEFTKYLQEDLALQLRIAKKAGIEAQ